MLIVAITATINDCPITVHRLVHEARWADPTYRAGVTQHALREIALHAVERVSPTVAIIDHAAA